MSVRTTTLTAVLTAVLLAVAGCGGGNGDEDTGTEDTGSSGAGDICCAPHDTGTLDTSDPNPDTSEPDDTSEENDATDTTEEDTGGTDTGGTDTSGTDTGDDAGDTGTESDTMADTATDTGGGNDTGTDTGMDTGDGTSSTTSIYDIRAAAESNNLQPGDSLSGSYRTEDVVVTGVKGDSNNPDGVFIQEPSGPAEDSGLWVFFGNAQSGVSVPTLEVGDRITVEGTVTNYDNNGGSSNGGLLEIHEVSEVTRDQQNTLVPSPTVISSPSTLAPGGSNAETYESVLVKVENVTVDSAPNQFDETLLNSGVRIGNSLYDYTQDFSPASGDTFSSVVGPLNFAYDKTQIMPREKLDMTK